MTKASIVQRLLDEGHITAEEAVVLLNNIQEPNITWIPYTPSETTNPYNPPFVPYCTTSTTDQQFEYSDTRWPGETPENNID